MRIVPISRSKGDLADIPPTRAALVAHVRSWYPQMSIDDVELDSSGPSEIDGRYSADHANSASLRVRELVASVNRFRDWPIRMTVFAVESVDGQPCSWPIAVIDQEAIE